MRKLYGTFNVLLVSVLVFFTACSVNNASGEYSETQFKMDTAMTIKAYGPDAKAAIIGAFQRIDEIEQLTSAQISTSDVSKINDAAGKDYISVNPEVLNIIKKSIEYSRLSNGAFDITVGPLIKLWGIGTKDARVPSEEEIKERLALVGFENIKIDKVKNSVKLDKTGMIIDLGGIAKGYAADQAVKVLTEHGIKKAIINLGGSAVFVIGTKDNNELWSIGLQHPRIGQGGGFMGILDESDKAVSTSGDYEKYFIKDGKRYHHILDPTTGYPAESGITADTIVLDSSIEDSSMDSDALSTIVFILGPEKGLKFIENIKGAQCIIATSSNKLLTTQEIKKNIKSISEDFKYDTQGR